MPWHVNPLHPASLVVVGEQFVGATGCVEDHLVCIATKEYVKNLADVKIIVAKKMNFVWKPIKVKNNSRLNRLNKQ